MDKSDELKNLAIELQSILQEIEDFQKDRAGAGGYISDRLDFIKKEVKFYLSGLKYEKI